MFPRLKLANYCATARLALKLVPCDHLDDRDAANAAATTLAEAQGVNANGASSPV